MHFYIFIKKKKKTLKVSVASLLKVTAIYN